jgi:hypothetical protein
MISHAIAKRAFRAPLGQSVARSAIGAKTQRGKDKNKTCNQAKKRIFRSDWVCSQQIQLRGHRDSQLSPFQ